LFLETAIEIVNINQLKEIGDTKPSYNSKAITI